MPTMSPLLALIFCCSCSFLTLEKVESATWNRSLSYRCRFYNFYRLTNRECNEENTINEAESSTGDKAGKAVKTTIIVRPVHSQDGKAVGSTAVMASITKTPTTGVDLEKKAKEANNQTDGKVTWPSDTPPLETQTPVNIDNKPRSSTTKSLENSTPIDPKSSEVPEVPSSQPMEEAEETVATQATQSSQSNSTATSIDYLNMSSIAKTDAPSNENKTSSQMPRTEPLEVTDQQGATTVDISSKPDTGVTITGGSIKKTTSEPEKTSSQVPKTSPKREASSHVPKPTSSDIIITKGTSNINHRQAPVSSQTKTIPNDLHRSLLIDTTKPPSAATIDHFEPSAGASQTRKSAIETVSMVAAAGVQQSASISVKRRISATLAPNDADEAKTIVDSPIQGNQISHAEEALIPTTFPSRSNPVPAANLIHDEKMCQQECSSSEICDLDTGACRCIATDSTGARCEDPKNAPWLLPLRRITCRSFPKALATLCRYFVED